MTKRFSRGLALAAAAVLGLFLGAQSNAQVLQAKVPFAFHVQDLSMPAGDYEFRVEAGNRAVTVQSVDGLAVTRFFGYLNTGPKGDGACLLFLRYGNSYFLDRVKTSMSPMAMQAPVTRKAREAERAARANARAEMAVVRVPATQTAR
jgi:hypothetical protein